MKKFCITLMPILLLASASCVPAQKSNNTNKDSVQQQRIREETERRKTVVSNLIADAKSQPAEFAADALIRLAESAGTTNAQQKIDLLEEAFRRASEAQHPVRLDYIVPTDTRAGMLSDAFNLELDKLSLQ